MDLTRILKTERDAVIDEWVRRLGSEVSPRYSSQPPESFYETVTASYDAYCAALTRNDFSEIDSVVERIGKLRFESGFSLSEVQKAFELFFHILLPLVVEEVKGPASEKKDTIDRVFLCVGYTIHMFSDYFQALSEKEIRNYARILEVKVEQRTRELADSEAKYRNLVEEIRDGYFVNQKGLIVFANRAFADMHGYTQEEVLGKPYTDFVAPESLEEVRGLYDNRRYHRSSRELYVYSRLKKDGTSLPTENKVVMSVYQGEAAAIGICRDITKRVEYEKRIREAESLAHIGNLTTSLAHEIRNPLSAIKMGIQMLHKTPIFKGNEKRRLEILKKEISRLDRIATEMLDLAKPIKFTFCRASITDLIESCLDVLEFKIAGKGIAVTRRFGEVPDTVMDREKMEQVVINILLNAIEAVESDGAITIDVNRPEGTDHIRVAVTDNGVGIQQGDKDYIFDPFFSRKARGTGLGLANAKRIIEAHSGSIEAVPARPAGLSMVFSILVR
jgi:PAS domain S-box-containing protein